MSPEPNMIDFDDQILELNYNDYKERFPKILEFYRLVHEYQSAPNLFVPTDGQQLYPGVRYKQNDVTTDWKGSWKHVADSFRLVDHTLRELLVYYGKRVKEGVIIPDSDDSFIPKDKGYFYTNTGNPYFDHYVNEVFNFRNYNNLNNTARDYLLKYESIFIKAMTKFSEENGDSFKEITQERIDRDLLVKTLSAMTGNEFFGLLERFLVRNNLMNINN